MIASRSPVPSSTEEERRFVQPFFVLVVISLIVTYGYSVVFTPAPARSAAPDRFYRADDRDGLPALVVHDAAHQAARYLVAYLVAQGALCFVITVIGDNIALALGLYMMMIGEAFGVLGINWRGVLAMVYLSVAVRRQLLSCC